MIGWVTEIRSSVMKQIYNSKSKYSEKSKYNWCPKTCIDNRSIGANISMAFNSELSSTAQIHRLNGKISKTKTHKLVLYCLDSYPHTFNSVARRCRVRHSQCTALHCTAPTPRVCVTPEVACTYTNTTISHFTILPTSNNSILKRYPTLL